MPDFHDSLVVDTASGLFSFELDPMPDTQKLLRVDCHLKATQAGTVERECVGQIQIVRSGRLIFQTATMLFGFNDSIFFDFPVPFPLLRGDVIGARGFVKNDDDEILLTAVVQ